MIGLINYKQALLEKSHNMVNKKNFEKIAISLIAFSLIGVTQGYSQTKLANWSFKSEFSYYEVWDYDLGRSTDAVINLYSYVMVEIGETGGGRLVYYVGNKKYICEIVESYQTANKYEFTYLNNNGRELTAYFTYRKDYKKKTGTYVNTILSFSLNNPENNTAMVFFN